MVVRYPSVLLRHRAGNRFHLARSTVFTAVVVPGFVVPALFRRRVVPVYAALVSATSLSDVTNAVRRVSSVDAGAAPSVTAIHVPDFICRAGLSGGDYRVRRNVRGCRRSYAFHRGIQKLYVRSSCTLLPGSL